LSGYVKIGDLTPRSRRVNLVSKVVSVGEPREVVSRFDGTTHKVSEVVIGDETGTIILTLWDDNIERVSEGDNIEIVNGYVSLFRGNMRLNVGRYGELKSSDSNIEYVNNSNNMSEKTFNMSPRRRYRRR